LLAQHLKRVVIELTAVRSSFAFHSRSIQELGLLSGKLVTATGNDGYRPGENM